MNFIKRSIPFSLFLLILLSSGCVVEGPQKNGETTNASTSPHAPKILPTSQSACDQIISDAGLEQIQSCYAESFDYENKKIDLASVSYGPPQDCPSGCFYDSYVGLIEDGKSFLLCSFGGYNRAENLELYPHSYILTDFTNSKIAYSNIYYGTEGKYYTEQSQCLKDAISVLFFYDEDCPKVPEERFKQTCLEQVQYRKDREYFESFDQFALTVENCNEIKTLELKEFCYTVVAQKQNKPEVCDLITDTYTKHYDCLYGMYSGVYSLYSPEAAVEPCKKIDPALPYGRGSKNSFEELDGTLKDHCFYYAALGYDKPSICSDISDETLRAKCYVEARG